MSRKGGGRHRPSPSHQGQRPNATTPTATPATARKTATANRQGKTDISGQNSLHWANTHRHRSKGLRSPTIWSPPHTAAPENERRAAPACPGPRATGSSKPSRPCIGAWPKAARPPRWAARPLIVTTGPSHSHAQCTAAASESAGRGLIGDAPATQAPLTNTPGPGSSFVSIQWHRRWFLLLHPAALPQSVSRCEQRDT